MMKLEEVKKTTHVLYIAKDFCCGIVSLNKRIPLIVNLIDENYVNEVVLRLLDLYGDIIVTAQKNNIEKEILISQCVDYLPDSIIVEGRPLTSHLRFDFSDLMEIMKKLRAENGCEWDRAQTHESIRINLIEEAYELVEAIDCNSKDMMLEECGDVLMQSVFHTEIASENGEFNYSDMLTVLCRKLVDRHTHIFGDNHADNADEALVFWNEAKKKEKKYSSNSDAMNRIPKNLPALLYSEKMQKIARKCGFDWTNVEDVILKVQEELNELMNADKEHQMEEAGDLLFAVVNLLRFFKIDPEIALHQANIKFYRRFSEVEAEVLKRGKEMQDCSFEELDSIWNDIKQKEKDLCV